MNVNDLPRPTPNTNSADSDAARPTRLLLICHGEGIHTRYSGIAASESGLTAAGWEQVSALASWLRSHEEIDLLFCSGQLRSRLTAQRIGQEMGLPVTVHPRLPTVPRHSWTAPPSPAADKERPGVAQDTGSDHAPPAGAANAADMDDYGQFCQEAAGAIEDILAQHWGKSIAVVTNVSSIATLLRHFFGHHSLAVHVEQTGLTELRYAGGQWNLVYVNRREHHPRSVLAAARQPSVRRPAAEMDEDLDAVRQVYDRVAARHAGGDRPAEVRAIRQLLDFARFPPRLCILEAGSGSGHIALALAQNGADEVIGIDISPAMLEQAEYLRLSSVDADIARRVSYRLAPAHDLPFPNARFDAAVCRLLLHLLKKPELALQAVKRVLKPGGCLVVADLLGDDDAVKRATQNAILERRNPGHQAVRSAQQYRQLLTGVGLVIEKEEVGTVERELNEWLADITEDVGTRYAVREMLEASMETDAAGLNVRRQNDTAVFSQRMIYLKARKPA